MKEQRKENVVLKVEKISSLGKGEIYFDNCQFYLDGAFPGDSVEFTYNEEQDKYLPSKINPESPDRIKSDCAYFGPCQGCDLIEISEKARQKLKASILKDTISRFCGSENFKLHPFQASPKNIRFLSRVRIHRGKKGNRTESGFLPSSDIGPLAITEDDRQIHDGVVPVNSCALLVKPLLKRLVAARRALSETPFPVEAFYLAASPVDEDSVSGHLIMSEKARLSQAKEHVEKMMRLVQLKGISFGRPDKPVEGVCGDLKLNGLIAPGVQGGPYGYEPSFFCQGNVEQNESMIKWILKFAEVSQDMKVVEGYAGAGNFSIPLALAGALLDAYESHPGAFRMGMKNIITSGQEKRINLYQADAGKVLSKVAYSPDILLVDPPRSGLYQTAEILEKLKPKKILYVSCNMNSLSKNGRTIIDKGYALSDAVGFDFFPRTHHVEALLCFVRK
ncbi:MAG: class I SAM-dependent RNA methyltransferase [Candidatus Riflebacteria bacterium]|nr:class I SAM-dependent RNA methyltransferase [Candidatus Riflebacteria bacterium]